MEDKEATPVEDVVRVLTPMEHKQAAPPEEQPENTTPTGEVKFQETLMKMMMEISKNVESTKEEIKSTKEKIKSTKEELNKKMDLQTTSRVKRWKE